MVSLMQNGGKTDNGKTMITFSSDDLSALRENLEYAKVNKEEFWNYGDFSAVSESRIYEDE